MPWRAAYGELERRVRALPDVVRRAMTAEEPPPVLGLTGIRRVVTTGVGTSVAHARLLAHLLAEHLGCDARFRPLGAFLAPAPVGSCDDLLVVVSQGLTPNVRVALADLAAWHHVVVVTATSAAEARRNERGDAADLVEHLAAVGVEVRQFAAGSEEYGTLVRVTGPMAGYLAVLRYAQGLAAAAGRANAMPACDADRLADAVAATEGRSAPLRALASSGRLGARLALLASGDYVGLVDNLRQKILEGMLLPLPPAYDLLDLAHGPFQQAYQSPATFLALTRPDAPREAELIARFAAMLDGGSATMLDDEQHAIVPLAATLPSPFALLEHEALMNELMLATIAARGIDQEHWPGQRRDHPLYGIGGIDEAFEPPVPSPLAIGGERRLAMLAWPVLGAALADGPRVAVVPLGATEQHGPHLPFATDTWIGDALAMRLAARLPEAIVCPTLPIGCSSEHLAFPGTLDLAPATLAAVLGDVLASLARHGFAGAFVFSAHGGNFAALAAMLPALATAAAPMPVWACTDLARVSAAWTRVAARHGIGAEVAGQHAGELETSIVMALRPDAVGARAAGHTAAVADPQTLFYPSLRDHAPDGTVGDPRGANAGRAEAYLEAWVDVLVDCYREGRPAKNAK